VLVAIDDTLFQRTGRKVHAIGWFHDGSAKDPHQVGLGNNWVIAAIVAPLPFLSRPVALPVAARLVHKHVKLAPVSRLVLARQMAAALAAVLPGRQIHVVADAAYAGKELRRLPASITWTTRLRKDAALYELAPPRTGKRGRSPRQGQTAVVPGHPRGQRVLRPGHRAPLRQDRHRARRRYHLPVARRLRRPPGPGRADPRPHADGL
jgi:hypothetical protein